MMPALDAFLRRSDRQKYVEDPDADLPPRPRFAVAGPSLADAVRDAERRVNGRFDPEAEIPIRPTLDRLRSRSRNVRTLPATAFGFRRPFAHLPEDCPDHRWIPGAEIWVCTECGKTKSKEKP